MPATLLVTIRDAHSKWSFKQKELWSKRMAEDWVQSFRDDLAKAVAERFPGSEAEYKNMVDRVIQNVRDLL